MSRLFGRALHGFGHFWIDFLFGDSPILAPATLAIVGVAFALRHDRAAAVALVPMLVVLLLGTTAYLGRRRPGPSPGGTARKGEPTEPA